MRALNKTLALLALCAMPAFTQHMRMLPAGEIYEFREVGAILGQENEQVKIMVAMPKDMRPKAYQSVDIAEGDFILFLNGKRVKALKEFEQNYNALAVGDTIKLGMRRKEERMIATFTKVDPKDLPQRTAHRVMIGGDGSVKEEKSTDGGKSFSFSRQIDSGAQDITPIPGLAVIIGSADGKVKIVDKLPIPVQGLEKVDLQSGDILQTLNGNAIANVAGFSAAYEKIAVGEAVTLKYLRKDKEVTASFNKPKTQGQFMIKTGN